MSIQFKAPADTVAGFHVFPEPIAGSFPYGVVLARPPEQPVPEALGRSALQAVLAVHTGCKEPNHQGRKRGARVLKQHGPVMVIFTTADEASAFHLAFPQRVGGMQ